MIKPKPPLVSATVRLGELIGLALAGALMLGLPRSGSAAAPVPDTLAQRALPCASCHLTEDRLRAGEYVPRIAGKPAAYLLEQLRNFRAGRRRHDGMERLIEHLDEAYLAELAGHFASLRPSRRPPSAPVDAES